MITKNKREWWIDGKWVKTEYYDSDGQLHREDEPAIMCVNGAKEWWIRGKRHREGGPAIVRADGTIEWWIEGAKVTTWNEVYISVPGGVLV